MFVRLLYLRNSCIFLSVLGACDTSRVERKTQQSGSFDQLVDAFSADYQRLDLPPLHLAFVDNINALGDQQTLLLQRAVFEKYADKLTQFDARTLRLCERIEYAIIETEVNFGRERAELGLRYLEQGANLNRAERLADIPLGSEWYRFYLNRWNGAKLDLDEIYAFGERQLALSVAGYDAIQAQLGFAGDAEGLAQHLANYQPLLDGDGETLALFSQLQHQVWERLPSLFASDYSVDLAAIKRSDRGVDFPVPGYYNLAEKTFYYNLVDAGFEARQADWLFLHEGTPGHHFQMNAASLSRQCEQRLPGIFHPAFVEGWAAYTETLGEALGLYQTPEARLAAIEWDMVRSVRVVLDVAINAYGWSDAQALDYWRTHVRGQLNLAKREIDRMKRWPAQVVTYKYGAEVFQRVKSDYEKTSDNPAATMAFHSAALTHGPMPLATFADLFEQMVEAVPTQQTK